MTDYYSAGNGIIPYKGQNQLPHYLFKGQNYEYGRENKQPTCLIICIVHVHHLK